MTTTALTSNERKALKKQTRPALLLGTLIFLLITILNLLIYYQDVILGEEGAERPPMYQLIVVEALAISIGTTAYYFPSKKWLKDLSKNQKNTEANAIHSMFVKMENGKPAYTLRLINKQIVEIDKGLYKTLTVGDTVEVTYAPVSEFIFGAEKVA